MSSSSNSHHKHHHSKHHSHHHKKKKKCCTGPQGAAGAAGAAASSSMIIPYNIGGFSLWNSQALAQLLSSPDGTNRLLILNGGATMPVSDAQEDIDSARNSFAWVAPRNGTLANLFVRMMVVLQDAPLNNNVTFNFQILTAPVVAAPNDFTLSPINATIVVPSGSLPEVELFFAASDVVNSIPILAGQRVLFQAAVTYDSTTGNQDEVFKFLSIAAGITFSS